MAHHDRRGFMVRGLQAGALLFAATTVRANCVDPDEISGSVQSMRDSLEYTDQAPDPKQACKDCAYFKAATAGDPCAHCEVLTSPVSATGHCVSWTKRD